MRRSGRTRIGAIAAAVAIALGAVLGGAALRPAPVSGAYCDDFPFLCLTFTANPQSGGAGAMTTPEGIDCRWAGGVKTGTCSKRYIKDPQTGRATVVVTATAADGSYVCTTTCHTYSDTATITVSSDYSYRADFYLADCSQVPAAWCNHISFELSGNGAGYVETDDGFISCIHAGNGLPDAGVCNHRYFVGPDGGGTTIHVVGTANASSIVCEDGTCGATRTFTQGFIGDRILYFEFQLRTYDVTVARAGSGTGHILSSPAGIDCGSTCKRTFTHGDAVTLTAVADAGSTFSSWSGACAGQDVTCDLTVTGDSTNTATFVKAGTTAPPATPTPSHTSTPGSSPAPGSSSSPIPGASTDVATPGASADPSPSNASSLGMCGSVARCGSETPGSAATDGATQVPGGGQTADERGPDLTILVLAILLGAVIIAIGLAVGLRRRRPGEGPPAEEPPAA